MTLLGKLFVMLNLALSLMLAATAFGVFAGGIDFSDNPAKGAQPPGKLQPVKAELDELLNKQAGIVETSWKTARNNLLAREDTRREDRTWYVAELRKLVEGKGAVQEVVPARQRDPNKLQILANAEESPGVPLMALPVYVDRLATLRKDNLDLRKQLEAKLMEDNTLTIKLMGTPKTRGLRQEVALERKKKAGIVDEQGIIEGMRINASVESELIFKRLAALEVRIGELIRYLKRKHNMDVPTNWR